MVAAGAVVHALARPPGSPMEVTVSAKKGQEPPTDEDFARALDAL